VLVRQIADILLAINRDEKMTLVVVEQNVPMLFRMTDRFIILEKGKIAVEGTREQVAASEVMKEYLAI
jgi:ABC-type branched-subunit amino acid transport system ATPase component